jgi:hypothetical protein
MYSTQKDYYKNSFEKIDLKTVNNDVIIKKLKMKNKVAYKIK